MIRKSLHWKLSLAFVLVTLITVALVSTAMRLTNPGRLTRLIIDQQRSDIPEKLAKYYVLQNSWQGVNEYWQVIRTTSLNPAQRADGSAPTPDAPFPPPDRIHRDLFGLADSQGNVIVPLEPDYPTGLTVPSDVLVKGIPVEANGVRVGTILVIPRPPQFTPEEDNFLQRTNQALLYTTLGAASIAVLVGILIARNLTRPLENLTRAAQKIAKGDLEQQVTVTSKDEIARLAEAFNCMSQEIARANLLRRQMTADIAHDLRTPLTVIAGYIESMQDGVLKPTPERLNLISTEIDRLLNLVSDLRTLSQADSGEISIHPQQIPPAMLLEHAAAPYRPRAEQMQIDLRIEAGENLPEIYVDEARMMQVFSNLMSNALRYTPEGGRITLGAAIADEKVAFTIQDTGCGIDPEDLPHIFERFYRTDSARQSENGEAGLGLAIARALVEAQGGTIRAESLPGQGSCFTIEFQTNEARRF